MGAGFADVEQAVGDDVGDLTPAAPTVGEGRRSQWPTPPDFGPHQPYTGVVATVVDHDIGAHTSGFAASARTARLSSAA